MKLKKGDKVKIITGKFKGKVDVIKKIDYKKEYAYFENVSKHKKHTKPNNLFPDGGIQEIEAPIHVSNLMYLDSIKIKKKKGDPKAKTLATTRIGIKKIDGVKKRYAKKSGRIL